MTWILRAALCAVSCIAVAKLCLMAGCTDSRRRGPLSDVELQDTFSIACDQRHSHKSFVDGVCVNVYRGNQQLAYLQACDDKLSKKVCSELLASLLPARPYPAIPDPNRPAMSIGWVPGKSGVRVLVFGDGCGRRFFRFRGLSYRIVDPKRFDAQLSSVLRDQFPSESDLSSAFLDDCPQELSRGRKGDFEQQNFLTNPESLLSNGR
jgi:hypothetical protein